MPEGRPDIPAELERAVLLEAGHRCAIPTCRFPRTELAHIVPWEKVKEHRFENLIALCPNCHTRYDRGEIDRKSMQAYKRNLPVVASRYTEMERRMLAELGAMVREGKKHPGIIVPGGSEFFFAMAQRDGLLEYVPINTAGVQLSSEVHGAPPMFIETAAFCLLTEAGKEFAERWLTGKEIPEPTPKE
jgi:hypothetical protein